MVKIFFYYKNLHISKIIYKFALQNLNKYDYEDEQDIKANSRVCS